MAFTGKPLFSLPMAFYLGLISFLSSFNQNRVMEGGPEVCF